MMKWMKWLGIIFGLLGTITAGTLFVLKMNAEESAKKVPSPVIDVKSIDKSLT